MIIENEMTVDQAQYIQEYEGTVDVAIKAVIDGIEMFVPLVEGNIHYDEIMRQVNAGTLTIQEAV